MVAVFAIFETSSIDSSDCQIVRISAVYGRETFDVMMQIRGDLDYRATAFNGFTKAGDGTLWHCGQQCHPVHSQRQGLEKLAEFIEECRDNDDDVQVNIVAHNAHVFSGRVLTRAFNENDVDFPENVFFTDSLVLAKPFTVRGSRRLRDLVEDFLGRTWDIDPVDSIKKARCLKNVVFHLARNCANERLFEFLERDSQTQFRHSAYA